MKTKHSLNFNIIPFSIDPIGNPVSGHKPTPGDISGRDGRYGFSDSWSWKVQVPTPENWDGEPLICNLSVGADDFGNLSFAGANPFVPKQVGPQGGWTYSEDTASVGVMPGFYDAFLFYKNINYNPPSGNVAILNYSISAGETIEIDPGDPDGDPEECECACDNDEDSGGISVYSPQTARSFSTPASASSSAGRNTNLRTGERFARWQTRFGAFRGLGGISSGTLEILSETFSGALATPQALEYRHLLASWLDVPEGGIAPNTVFKHCKGARWSSWMCDGNKEKLFKIGTPASKSEIARFNSDKTLVEIVFSDKSSVMYSALNGEFVSYKTRNGNVISANELSDYLDVVRDSNGILQQVWNRWDGLMRVENITDNGYTIALYRPSEVGEKDLQSGLYSVTGAAFKTFTVLLSGSKITITELDSRVGATAFPLSFWFENNAWNQSEGTGAEEIFTNRVRTNLADGTWNLQTTIKRGENGVVESNILEVYKSTFRGDFCISRTLGYDTDFAQTTHFEYNNYGKLIAKELPSGAVFTYDFDSFGRLSVQAEPWSGGRRKITYFYYRDDSTNNSELDYSRVAFEKADGSAILFSRTNYTYLEESGFRRLEKRTSGLGSGNTQLEIEEVWLGTAENIYARGRVKMIQDKVGVQTHYNYAGTSAHGALYSVTAETRIDGVPADGKSTRDVKFISAEGNALREEKYILDSEGAWKLIASADFEYDSQNRWTKKTHGNARETTREMMCCGTLWEVDEDGIRTNYYYNSAKELVETMRSASATMPERVTVYTRNVRGNVLSETLKLDGPTFSAKSKTYDVLGRLVSESDELGRVTTHAYSADTLTQTTTLPSGATLITTKHADGTILHRAGTGQREFYFAPDAVSDGLRMQTKLADNSTIISREIRNCFGETIRTGTINTADDFFYTRHLFDERGLRTQSQVDGMAPTLFEYDAFGNEIRKTLKLATSPTTENSRIFETNTVFETRGNEVYSVTLNTRYNDAGVAILQSSARLVSESSVFESKTISTDIRGNVSTTWTEFAGATIRLQKSQIPTAANIAQTRIVDGFTTQQSDYAGTLTEFTRTFNTSGVAGIVLTFTDGRANTTTTEQNVLGWTTKTTDAAGNITTTLYNLTHGKPSLVTNALGKTTQINYDLRGRKIAEFGTAVQPAVFAYDDADNLVSQKLFRTGTETISTDPASRTDFDETTWNYDAETNLLLTKTFPDEEQIDYTYDAKNRLKDTIYSREVSAGTRLKSTRTYKAQSGELLSVSYNDNARLAETRTYDFLGKVLSVSDAAGTTSFVYNTYGELESESTSKTGASLQISRDSFGRESTMTFKQNNSVKALFARNYNAQNGRLNSAHFGPADFNYEYLSGTNLVSKLTYLNGAFEKNILFEEKRNLPVEISYKKANSDLLAKRNYTFNALGNAINRTQTRGSEPARNDAFSYNDRNELVAASLGNDEYSYAFDNIGNRLTAEELALETQYSTNNLNQYTEIIKDPNVLNVPINSSTFEPTFDADGNQTLVKTNTGIWSVSYNGANRPITFTKGTTTIHCKYDLLGRRCEKKVIENGTTVFWQRYAYENYLQIAAFDVTEPTAGSEICTLKHIVFWDPSEPVATRPLAISIENVGSFFYTHDLTKNVCELIDTNLKIAQTYDYAPFGAVTVGGSAIANPFQFSSEVHDSELALNYYNYRHYNPADGRWLSRDPIAEQGGLNLYAFMQNYIYQFDYLGSASCQISIAVGHGIWEENNWPKERTKWLTSNAHVYFYNRFLSGEPLSATERYAIIACGANYSDPGFKTTPGLAACATQKVIDSMRTDGSPDYSDKIFKWTVRRKINELLSAAKKDAKRLCCESKGRCIAVRITTVYIDADLDENIPELKKLKNNYVFCNKETLDTIED